MQIYIPERPAEPPSLAYTKKRVLYLSFFLGAPLTFAVPRRVFCLFLRCLPVSVVLVAVTNSWPAFG
jgi:hypothetical protein